MQRAVLRILLLEVGNHLYSGGLEERYRRHRERSKFLANYEH